MKLKLNMRATITQFGLPLILNPQYGLKYGLKMKKNFIRKKIMIASNKTISTKNNERFKIISELIKLLALWYVNDVENITIDDSVNYSTIVRMHIYKRMVYSIVRKLANTI